MMRAHLIRNSTQFMVIIVGMISSLGHSATPKDLPPVELEPPSLSDEVSPKSHLPEAFSPRFSSTSTTVGRFQSPEAKPAPHFPKAIHEFSAKSQKPSSSPAIGYTSVDRRPSFDLPVTYNGKVKEWIIAYQTTSRNWFKKRLERSATYLPVMQKTLRQQGLPQDLAYIAMIESGFSAHATSDANAVGYWQFIEPTASRYGLKVNWWLDERRDFNKSTLAAARYISDLYREFKSWYLTAAAFNMGEGRTRYLIKKYNTDNYWVLAEKPGFPEETRQYIPKMIAAILIAKTPKLYGFFNVQPDLPYSYEYFFAPGGTDLENLAVYLGVSRENLRQLNPELIQGFIPPDVANHRIRIPKGFTRLVAQYVRSQIE